MKAMGVPPRGDYRDRGYSMERILDDADFVDVQDLVEKLTEWITCPVLAIGRNARLGCGDGTTYSRAVLVERKLTDGSPVYDVRLS
jgi:hypothetical protein